MNDLEEGRGTLLSVFAFLAGAAVGSGLALLTARRTGMETRQALRDVVAEAGQKTRGYVEKGKESFDAMRSKLTTTTGEEETLTQH